jgi:hypothetical protein
MESSVNWDRFQWRALGIGAAALLLCVGGAALLGRAAFFRSYLVACNFWLGIALGGLAIVMIHHLTGGGWGRVIRRLLESATRTLPVLALLFVPLLFGLHDLYKWTDQAAVASDELLQHKSLYLNTPFFVIRAAVYFVAWIVIAYFLNRWSRQQDETADPGLPRRFRLLSGPGLVICGLTITFAAVDWLMSLEPHWVSTIFPVVIAVGQVLAAFAFAIAAAALLASRPPLSEAITAEHLNDLGNLLLAFVMLWAYVSFSQFLLIWSGNLPEEVRWYIPRFQGGWEWVGAALLIGQFALPFLLLLSRDVKRNPRSLAVVAGIVLVMRFVDLLWQVVPAFEPEGLLGHWLDLLAAPLAALGVGGVWVAAFLWQLRKMPLLPLHDPAGEEAAHHG